MNKMKRNPVIEYARWVFSFLVVCIHVPLAHGGMLYMPLARCAVPFFYLVTGYFLAKSMGGEVVGEKILKSSRKWFMLWAKYTIIFLLISLFLDFFLSQFDSWTLMDTKQMLRAGVCPFIDQHGWDGRIYGISTLWFLYCGFIVLCLLYALKKYIFTIYFLIIVAVLQVLAITAVYLEWTRWLFFYSSLPFLYYGMWIGHNGKKQFPFSLSAKQLAYLSFALFCAGVVEFIFNKDVVIANIPLSLSIFLYLVKLMKSDNNFINKILPPLFYIYSH